MLVFLPFLRSEVTHQRNSSRSAAGGDCVSHRGALLSGVTLTNTTPFTHIMYLKCGLLKG